MFNKFFSEITFNKVLHLTTDYRFKKPKIYSYSKSDYKVSDLSLILFCIYQFKKLNN